MTLLELPVITEISHSEGAPKLIVASPNDQSTLENTVTESGSEGNFMIIGPGTESSTGESSQPKEEHTYSSEIVHPILWGCKQCDFRFVEYIFK